jgi:hypothetical protein
MSSTNNEASRAEEKRDMNRDENLGQKKSKGMVAPSKDQSACLKRPSAHPRGSGKTTKPFGSKPKLPGGSNDDRVHTRAPPDDRRGDTSVKTPTHKSFAAATAHGIKKQLNIFRDTAVYLKGRDLMYEDAVALARFNTWVIAHQEQLDPSEQFVCNECGHVDFVLCAHCVKEPKVALLPTAAVVVPNDQRYHFWEWRPVQTLINAIHMPKFDTHATDDLHLNGMSNHHISDKLTIQPLFSYLTLNMMTSYEVNGREDRALRLSHVHKLALKWLKERKLESQAEEDHHYSVRVKFTIQRACDNSQNSMLYGQRNPTQNFGLAWLPKSHVLQAFLLIAMIFLAGNPGYLVGAAIRVQDLTTVSARVLHFTLSYTVGTAPDLVSNLFVSATTPQSGKMLEFLCAETEYQTLWYAPEGDAYTVIQSCSFTDWVMAGINEASYRTSGIYEKTWTGLQMSKDEKCAKLSAEHAGYKLIWSSEKFAQALGLGQITPPQLLRLWLADFWNQLLLSVFLC